MHLPRTKAEWEKIEKETVKRWQFPNCIDAADGKHIAILHPVDSGSEFFNYKGFLLNRPPCFGRLRLQIFIC